ncbi:hypothetical protein GPECTOR_7g980 [Gonium pectorale]|uniref:Helicase C-terminal domain-containing protein n=1 Tax=Gonium pectorale TaxID=33097 RepID=A0A150GVZ3_GONPE|nr:hypothetical protein GPECTOR_7g980 [Gonium pectorale]|eukprot:KXZ53530.1 hypothetical protein GPECTOR_7g980 [Gonium pectorale]
MPSNFPTPNPPPQKLRGEGLRLRVVGLSATPGSTPEAVQEVIRNLGTSRVEFRSEEDKDVSPYTHRKQASRAAVDVLEVPPDDMLRPVAEGCVSLLRGVNNKLMQFRVVERYDAENVGRFGYITKMKQFQASLPDNKTLAQHSVPKIYHLFNQAIFLATLLETVTGQGARPAADLARVEMAKNSTQSLKDLANSAEWKEVMLEHFGLKQPGNKAASAGAVSPGAVADVGGGADGGNGGGGEGTGDGDGAPAEAEAAAGPRRVIIFTTLRDTVAEIVSCLERHAPAIVPRVFVGQGARGGSRAAGGGRGGGGGGRGRGRGKGRGAAAAAAAGPGEAGEEGGAAAAATMTMNQEEQRAVLQGFRDGTFNVLVATCIGEEGLDIPEVDLIVCYDSSASPTRQVQRMGRTGRHREGRVVYVLAAGKETENYYRSQEEMRRLQNLLRNASHALELSNRSPSMLPPGCHPRPVLLKLQEAAAAVLEHAKQQQAAAKKQAGKRGAAAAAGGDGGAAPGGKRRKGAAAAAGAATVADVAAAAATAQAQARWNVKRQVAQAVITISDDEEEDGAAGGPWQTGAAGTGAGGPGSEVGEDVTLAQRALARARKATAPQKPNPPMPQLHERPGLEDDQWAGPAAGPHQPTAVDDGAEAVAAAEGWEDPSLTAAGEPATVAADDMHWEDYIAGIPDTRVAFRIGRGASPQPAAAAT